MVFSVSKGMKFKCLKCGTEFEAKMEVQCPKCGEVMKVKPIYTYHYPKTPAKK